MVSLRGFYWAFITLYGTILLGDHGKLSWPLSKGDLEIVGCEHSGFQWAKPLRRQREFSSQFRSSVNVGAAHHDFTVLGRQMPKALDMLIRAGIFIFPGYVMVSYFAFL